MHKIVSTFHITLDDFHLVDIRSTNLGIIKSYTNVKRMELQRLFVSRRGVIALTTVFPSLESLKFDDCCIFGYAREITMDDHPLFGLLGSLKNLHTLELDCSRWDFAADISTESGPSKLVTLAALSRLRTLLVPVDFFVCFTPDDKKPRMQRTTILLPDSLRHLTLLLNDRCKSSLSREGSIPKTTLTRMVEPFMREFAPVLLIDFPRLEKVDLCYDMDDYPQQNVHPLAARFTDGRVAAS